MHFVAVQLLQFILNVFGKILLSMYLKKKRFPKPSTNTDILKIYWKQTILAQQYVPDSLNDFLLHLQNWNVIDFKVGILILQKFQKI